MSRDFAKRLLVFAQSVERLIKMTQTFKLEFTGYLRRGHGYGSNKGLDDFRSKIDLILNVKSSWTVEELEIKVHDELVVSEIKYFWKLRRTFKNLYRHGIPLTGRVLLHYETETMVWHRTLDSYNLKSKARIKFYVDGLP